MEKVDFLQQETPARGEAPEAAGRRGRTHGIDAQAVSNTGVTPDIASGDVAKRLRRSATAVIGPTLPSTPEIAGQAALCVDVPLSGGTAVYCALSSGALARLNGGDLTVELTTYAAVADEAQFATTR